MTIPLVHILKVPHSTSLLLLPWHCGHLLHDDPHPSHAVGAGAEFVVSIVPVWVSHLVQALALLVGACVQLTVRADRPPAIKLVSNFSALPAVLLGLPSFWRWGIAVTATITTAPAAAPITTSPNRPTPGKFVFKDSRAQRAKNGIQRLARAARGKMVFKDSRAQRAKNGIQRFARAAREKIGIQKIKDLYSKIGCLKDAETLIHTLSTAWRLWAQRTSTSGARSRRARASGSGKRCRRRVRASRASTSTRTQTLERRRGQERRFGRVRASNARGDAPAGGNAECGALVARHRLGLRLPSVLGGAIVRRMHRTAWLRGRQRRRRRRRTPAMAKGKCGGLVCSRQRRACDGWARCVAHRLQAAARRAWRRRSWQLLGGSEGGANKGGGGGEGEATIMAARRTFMLCTY